MKLKTYLIIGAVLFVLYAVVGYNIRGRTIKYQESEIARLELNNYQLMSDARQQTNLYFREKEVTGKLKRERDSLAGVLKIKPKQITKIIYKDNKIIDTVRLMVPVERLSKTEWMLRDSTKCFLWQAKVVLKNDSLLVNRTNFNYHNITNEVYYRKKPFNFWFIHLGKAINYQQISSECGSVQIKTFNFNK